MASKPTYLPPLATTSATFLSTNRRDRPWLLPSNRKLRNLTSISLRNLSLNHSPSSPTSRRRGRTIVDDDALPNTLKSPAKIVALREQRQALEHSRSSEDLKALVEHSSVTDGEANGSPLKGRDGIAGAKASARPIKRLRRRSTLEWANATPQRRQEKLESVTGERMADCFFSLHVKGLEEPIYISETVEKTMNPTFRYIDFSACGPGITRLDHVIVKVWIRPTKEKQKPGRWRHLIDMEVELKGLQYLGKNIDNFHHALPPNALLFNLTDGVYTSFSSLTDYVPAPLVGPARQNSTRPLPTSSFDALLRLAKLDDSIQDALETRNKLASDLESLFQINREALNERDRVPEADDRVKTIDYAKKTVEKQLEKARRQAEEKRESLRVRRRLMDDDLSTRSLSLQQMLEIKPELPHYHSEREVKKSAIQNQRRRICEDLQKIYPISPVPKKSLAFTIRDLSLPNSDALDDVESPDILAAALGYVSHVVLLLSFYLSRPLPYPVNPRGSASNILDPISILKPATNSSKPLTEKAERLQRTYPLFTKGGVPRFRFEYAVFLLNKDIQILLETCFRVRVLDVRQTLVNLKYLLYVATAGEGELPARKAGGVRGLLKGRDGSRGVSPSGSIGSVGTGSTLVGSSTGGALKMTNGKLKGPVESGGGAADSLRRNMGHG